MNLSDKLKSLIAGLTEPAEENDDYEGELTFEKQENGFENGTFLNSLDDLSERDIELNAAAEQAAKLSFTEILRRIVFYSCFAVFIVSCLLLVQNLIAKQRGVEIYDRLEQEFFSTGFSLDLADAFRPDEGAVKYLAAGAESPTLNDMTSIRNGMEAQNAEEPAVLPEEEHNEELEKMRAGLMSLARINPDVYGWITVEGTNINYPLVQGEDNDYYLNHAYTGEFLPNGSIFVDYRNYDDIMKNFNTVMYGHNIPSGAMFHDVEKFIKDATYKDYFYNTTINIYTNDGIFIYEPFAVYKTRMDYNYFKTGFKTPGDFVTFCEEVKANSKHQKDMTFTETDRIITMSTCTNILNSERYALHAKLIKAIVE